MAAKKAPRKKTNLTAGATTAGNQGEFPSAFSLFGPSWEGLQQNLVELVFIFVVPTLVILFLSLAAGLTSTNSDGSQHVSGGLGILTGAFLVVSVALLGPAIVHIQLKSSLNQKATYASAWATSKKYWWRFLVLTFMLGITILVGFILLIVPGVIFIKRYFLFHYALIDEDLGLVESMKRSNQLSKDRSMTVYSVLGVEVLISIVGSILRVIPVLGQVATLLFQVTYFCAPAIRYQQLKATLKA